MRQRQLRALASRLAQVAALSVALAACDEPPPDSLELKVSRSAGVPKPGGLVVYLRDMATPRAVAVAAYPVDDGVLVAPSDVLPLGLDMSAQPRGEVLVYVQACAANVACLSGPDGQPACPCSGVDGSPASPLGVATAQVRVRGRTVVSLTLDPLPAGCDADLDGFLDARNPVCSQASTLGGAAPFLDCDDALDAAHPFRVLEPSTEDVRRDPALVGRHVAQCGDGIDQDCSGADAVCDDARDSDADGDPDRTDCSPTNPAIHHAATEVCDTAGDDNCDGVIAPPCDEDGDGVANGEDCAPFDGSVYPGAPEVCGDGVDQDCAGGDIGCFANDQDLDGDGVPCPGQPLWGDHTCSGPGEDCNDLDRGVFPGAPEVCGDGIDQDCSGGPNDGDAICPSDDRDGDGARGRDYGGSDCDDGNRAVFPGARERCGDGIDQDCSGADAPCDPSKDGDGDGFADRDDCQPDDALSYPGAAERCDDVDNDCDRVVDEGNPRIGNGAPAGRAPLCGDACPSPGVPCDCRVAANACVRANAGDGEQAASVVCLGIGALGRSEGELTDCNGIDDDCDGRADEAPGGGGPIRRDCYTGVEGTRDVGVCVGGTNACNSELGSNQTRWSEACDGQRTPSPEVCDGSLNARGACCDGLDQDCDGQTDEPSIADLGVAYAQACYRYGDGMPGAGPCRLGREACVDGAFGECAGQRGPSGEQCNGVDDDCDGTVDDGNPGGDVACNTELAGVCAAGQTRCERGALRCNQRVQASDERCDDLDNDCDGRVDEGFVFGDCSVGIGACRRTGQLECTRDGRATACNVQEGAPRNELCGNLVDDDCDRNTDEGFNVGEPCSAGLGVCTRAGEYICSDDMRSTRCSASAGPAGAELCGTGVNEDCDMNTDEGFRVGASCTVGEGVCQRSGTRMCSADGLSDRCDAQPSNGLPNELCGNGMDDNCDGRTDEGFANLGMRCTAGVGACRVEGRFVCRDDSLATVCDAVPGRGADEVCNGIDDDCDNAVDDDAPCPGVQQCREGMCR